MQSFTKWWKHAHWQRNLPQSLTIIRFGQIIAKCVANVASLGLCIQSYQEVKRKDFTFIFVRQTAPCSHAWNYSLFDPLWWFVQVQNWNRYLVYTLEELECKICYNRYDYHSRKPKLLGCLHRVCAKCLKKLVTIGEWIWLDLILAWSHNSRCKTFFVMRSFWRFYLFRFGLDSRALRIQSATFSSIRNTQH